MNPIILLAGALGLMSFMKKPARETPPEERPGSPTTTKPNIPGAPSLTIDQIHNRPGQLLDNVKWTVTADGQTKSGKHESRKEKPESEQVGSFLVVTQTDPTPRPGEKKPDTVMLLVKDRQNRTVIAKRVIIGTKQIIDIQ
jgi:hypothetical protein